MVWFSVKNMCFVYGKNDINQFQILYFSLENL